MTKTIAAAIAATLILTGCTTENGDSAILPLRPIEVTLNDGRTVTCIKAVSANGVALSCDWEGANR